MHRLFVPAQAVGANTVYFDLFVPSGSNATVSVEAVIPIVSGAVAVVGTVGIDIFLTRTTAVGTGGTAATYGGTSLTAMTFSSQDNSQLLDTSLVTARLTPTGGATAGEVLSWRSLFGEETNDATYTQILDMVRGWNPNMPGVAIRPGQGVRVVQGSVASAGNVGFDVYLNVVTR
jgi:hypothetical protein